MSFTDRDLLTCFLKACGSLALSLVLAHCLVFRTTEPLLLNSEVTIMRENNSIHVTSSRIPCFPLDRKSCPPSGTKPQVSE
ncbi:uncharacterized protein K444DRAFT_94897 [Hyaloscypha bicolor E]|uniref:Uncharacterized protein n=1 Tax=Hyaloscypha bicolor E TaxID=1095630 RepID=A0A2J6SW55_9HELO|nr:uncharacterized protein K444DRAFT_94897 [Hyaloscypha bicolor E]PMD55005.1 hypothetical protein K444DRAFT_94897 [Hyaloscypha bicolor E]